MITLYQDKNKKWRWRIRHKNTKIIGASSESFSSRAKCVQDLKACGLAFINAVRWDDDHGFSVHYEQE